MKKVLLVMAVAGFAVACNNSGTSTEKAADSTVKSTVDTAAKAVTNAVDSTKKAVDSTVKAKVDSVKK
jgi:cytochrome c5